MMSGCNKEKLHVMSQIRNNDQNYLRLGVVLVVVEEIELECFVCMFGHHQQLDDG